jgi:hypothetical protein
LKYKNIKKEVLTKCGDAQFADMNTMRPKKGSLLNSFLRTGPVRYVTRQKMLLKKYRKKLKNKVKNPAAETAGCNNYQSQ